jgi:hypothetical protein
MGRKRAGTRAMVSAVIGGEFALSIIMSRPCGFETVTGWSDLGEGCPGVQRHAVSSALPVLARSRRREREGARWTCGT